MLVTSTFESHHVHSEAATQHGSWAQRMRECEHWTMFWKFKRSGAWNSCQSWSTSCVNWSPASTTRPTAPRWAEASSTSVLPGCGTIWRQTYGVPCLTSNVSQHVQTAFVCSQHHQHHRHGTFCRTHSREKPYKCYLCDKAFSHCGSLNIHMRVHTGYKPYKCSLCNQSFRHSGNLQTHNLYTLTEVTSSRTLLTFKSTLKTYLFSLSFPDV